VTDHLERDDLERQRITPLVVAFLSAVALMLVLFVLFGWLYWQSDQQVGDLAADRAAQDAVIGDLAGSVDDLREQVAAEGLRPVAPPPEDTIREGREGREGRVGATGSTGAQGIPGRDGRDGITPACWFEQSQCRGADGRDGVDGQDGTDGVDGTNGTNGIDGRDGADGAPGPACPPGYEQRVIENGPQAGWVGCAPVG